MWPYGSRGENRSEVTDDGFATEEGTFTICTFWLCLALHQIGARQEAEVLGVGLGSDRQPGGGGDLSYAGLGEVPKREPHARERSRIERRTLLTVTLAVMALGNAASAFAPNYTTLLALRLVMLAIGALYTPQAAGTAALIVPAEKREVIERIKRAAEHAGEIYLATDPDREGEAISWHVSEVLGSRRGLKHLDIKRVVFNEVTKNAVLDAFTRPREIDRELVEAYLARRALDYLVGFTLSPILWRKLPGHPSACVNAQA